MPSLINKKILEQNIQDYHIDNFEAKIEKISNWKNNLENIKGLNERRLQSAFLSAIFEDILGYNNEPVTEEWTMEIECSTDIDARTPDGILGFYKRENGEVRKEHRAVIELKGPQVALDKDQKREGATYKSPVDQAFSYTNRLDKCKWVIVSNFIELRLYKVGRSKEYNEIFHLQDLVQEEEFKRFHYLMCRDHLINKDGKSETLSLTQSTDKRHEDISVEFYNLYKNMRINLFEHLKEYNEEVDFEVLLEKAQKFLDRIIFICFCEDKQLLPNDLLHQAIKRGKDSFEMSDTAVWNQIRGVFRAVDEGSEKHNVNGFDGGLFAYDEALDELTIKNDFFDVIYEISEYDFDSDVDVNILGHIFEQSITDIEQLKADIREDEYDESESRRKKEGIYYTPRYITSYIVENAVGEYLEDKKEELGYYELPDIEEAGSKSWETRYTQQHIDFYDRYEEELKDLTVLDPACGSGAFLNQAFDFLLEEHRWVNKQRDILRNALHDSNGAAERDDELQASLTSQERIYRNILKNNLYGVDLNRESVEITKLSLWLKTANKQDELTNLDDNIKCGNSLIDDPEIAGDKAFNWNEEFTEIINGGGFDVVIGNPPYVRQEKIKWMKPYLKENYEVYKGRSDLYTYFYEKGINLIKNNGFLSFISSSKFLEAKYGKKTIKFLINNSKIDKVIDFKDSEIFSGITAYPVILVLEKKQIDNYEIDYSVIRCLDVSSLEKKIKENLNKISIEIFKENDFNLISEEVNNLIEKRKSDSVRFNRFSASPLTGIKTGYNKAYIKNGKFNSRFVKPYAFGEDIKRYQPVKPENKIIFPYKYNDKNGKYQLIDIENQDKIKDLLNPHKERLKKRAIIKTGIEKGTKRWYEFQQINKNINFDNEFIVYPNVSSGCNFTISKGNAIDMTAFIIPTNNRYVLSILNSSLIEFLMEIWAIKRRGGYLEYKKQYINKIPIKNISSKKQEPFVDGANQMLLLNKKLINKKNIKEGDIIYKYASSNGPSIKKILNESNFRNKIYSKNARKVREFTVSSDTNIMTLYTAKSNKGRYELLKFEEDNKYKRKYIKYYLESLTEEQLEEINDKYEGNLLKRVLQIEIPDYDKDHVVRKVVQEWEDLEKEIEELEDEIEETDKEIDQMVYYLYDLSKEEIKLVEDNT